MITNRVKNIALLVMAIIILILGTVVGVQINLRKNDRIAAELALANSNVLIEGKSAEIRMRDTLIADIRRERHSDSLKNSTSQNALKLTVSKLVQKLHKLPTQIVYNPDSATVDSLRVSFALKDSVIDTQALMIMNLETEKQGLFASFTREVEQLTDQRAAQVDISNQLQTQLVEERGKTRKEKRKRKFWRTVSVAAAGGIAFLLLKPN